MPAPKGHPLWGNPRKPKKYTPDKLWIGAVGYFEWCDKNPIMILEQSKLPQRLPANYDKKKHGAIKNFTQQIVKLPHQRAYSIEGLCNYLNMSVQTFDNYSKDKKYQTYFGVCSRVRQIIDSQHFEGGMVGLFNANIVTRKLGLQEKIQTSQNIIISPMSEEEAAEISKVMDDAKKD